MFYPYSRNRYTVRPYGYAWSQNFHPYQMQYNPSHSAYFNNPYYFSQMQVKTNGYLNNSFPSYPSPYPSPYQGVQPEMKPQGVQNVLQQFKKKDGTYDINKLMDTAGQMMGTVNQVNSIVKGLTKAFKV